MTPFPEQPTLPQLQRYMAAICQERGWTQDNYAEKFLLFTEEIGELAKAIRKTRGLYQEQARQSTLNLEEEFADVLSYLLDLANFSRSISRRRSGRKRRSTPRGRGIDRPWLSPIARVSYPTRANFCSIWQPSGTSPRLIPNVQVTSPT